MSAPAAASTRWNVDDDRRLRQLYAAGFSLVTIAADLGRSYRAVAARRDRLQLAVRRRARPWSDTETAFLAAAVRAGIPAAAIAERLGRSVDAVKNRRRALRLVAPASGRPYQADEDAAIRQSFLHGDDVRQLAQRLGRSPDALRLRARILGVHEPRTRRRWTPTEDTVVRDGYRNALSCSEIAHQLAGRSAEAVAARARKLGLADFGRTWTPRDDARLRFLCTREYTVDRIAEALIRTPEAVRARRRRLGLPAPAHSRKHAGRRWTVGEDELLTRHAELNPATLARWLGRSDRAVTQRLRNLNLTKPGVRSPHHPVPRRASLTPAERQVARREGAGDPARALVIAARLRRDPRTIRQAAHML